MVKSDLLESLVYNQSLVHALDRGGTVARLQVFSNFPASASSFDLAFTRRSLLF